MIIKPIQDVSNDKLHDFSCGIKDLDRYLKKFAKENDINGYGKTYLLFDDDDVLLGFFTICSSSIKFEELPKDVSDKLPKYPIPAVRIARLAVDKRKQKLGYGRELLKQTFLKILLISESIGIRMIIVDAKKTSASFYEKYGFRVLSNEKLTYYLLLDTLRKAIK